MGNEPGRGGPPALTAAAVAELRAAARDFGPQASARKTRLLRAFAGAPIEDPHVLLAYHDCLMFLLAYPQNSALRQAAAGELDRVAREARRLSARTARDRWTLEDSGVAWSLTRVSVSLSVARWLANRYPDHTELSHFGEDGSPLRSILQLCLPGMEESVLAIDQSSDDLLARLTHEVPGSRLAWLIDQLDAIPCSEETREHLFDSLRPFLLVTPEDSDLSRTFARGILGRPFFHRGELVKTIDLHAVLSRSLPPARRLAVRERWRLIDAARSVLTLLGRETAPIRLCAPAGVRFHELERGLAIALYAFPPGRRPPLDTHLGFVLFKNAVPVAYGGGWPFLAMCRIGIHVFDPFRGGESTLAFAQVLRVYRQLFQTRRFVAEPSQFGEGEREGLTSGAFWFYHRLGFRPIDRRLARLAETEAARMRAEPNHRTPVGVLRRFATSDLELVLDGGDSPEATCDPGDLSAAVTRWIGTRFAGDRAAAARAAVRAVSRSLGVRGRGRWPDAERRSYDSLCLLLALVSGLGAWSAGERAAAVRVMRAKGGADERRFFGLLLDHARLTEALASVAAVERKARDAPEA